MNLLLAAALLPLHFTAPADTLSVDGAGQVSLSSLPVHAYLFRQVDAEGRTSVVPGFADSTGRAILMPHAPGTRETVWLAPGANGSPATVYVLSQDASGNLSRPSNGCVLLDL